MTIIDFSDEDLARSGPYLDETVTVGALVRELLKLDQAVPLTTEGCDCTGEVVAIEVSAEGVYLKRRRSYGG
jgi:hypothetical protein